MKRKIYIFCLSLLLSFCLLLPVSAESQLTRVYDGADLLTDTEESELRQTLDEISERQQCDVCVATVESTGDTDIQTYTDDFYDNNGYGMGENKDGILLLVNIGERKWYITTVGYGITAITDAGREYISEQFSSDLSDGNYASAFTTYAKLCDEFITQADTGTPYDTGNLPSEPYSPIWIPISILIGFVIAFLITLVMRFQLKSVKQEQYAANYVKEGSLKLFNSQDIFLYSQVERREKPKDDDDSGSDTHMSSSGTEHGGGGGSF